jgi:hypothetical protein
VFTTMDLVISTERPSLGVYYEPGYFSRASKSKCLSEPLCAQVFVMSLAISAERPNVPCQYLAGASRGRLFT